MLQLQNYLPPPTASSLMAFIGPRKVKRDGQKFIVRKGRWNFRKIEVTILMARNC